MTMTDQPVPDGLEADAYRTQASHYADRLAELAHQELVGRHEQAVAGFDIDWGQFDRMHDLVLSGGFDDGSLAYRYFVLGAELRRRRRPAHENDRGAEAALRHAETLGATLHADFLVQLAVVRQEMSRLAEALDDVDKALRILKDQNGPLPALDKRVMSHALAVRGAVLHDLGRLEDSVLSSGEALTVAESLGDPQAVQLALVNLGVALARMADYDTALNCHQRALALSAAGGNQMAVQRQQANIAEVLRRLGRNDEARRVAESALAMTRELGDRREESRRLLLLAAVAMDTDDPGTAEDLAEQARDLAESVGDPVTVADAMVVQAAAREKSESPDTADALRRAAADLLDTANRGDAAARLRSVADERRTANRRLDRMFEVVQRLSSAQRQAARGDLRGALAVLYRLVDEVRGIDDPPVLGLSLLTLGKVLTAAGRPGEALAAHDEGANVDQESPAAVQNLLARAAILRDASRPVEAVIAYDEAVAYCHTHEIEGEPLGRALAELGRLGWQLNAYRSAERVYAEAADLLRRAGSAAVDAVLADRARLSTARSQGADAHQGTATALSDDDLRRELARVADAGTRTITVRLGDGTTFTGPPRLVHLGTVPMLVIAQQGRDALVPVDRITAISAG